MSFATIRSSTVESKSDKLADTNDAVLLHFVARITSPQEVSASGCQSIHKRLSAKPILINRSNFEITNSNFNTMIQPRNILPLGTLLLLALGFGSSRATLLRGGSSEDVTFSENPMESMDDYYPHTDDDCFGDANCFVYESAPRT